MEKKKRKIRWWAWLAATIALVAIVWGIRLYILTHTEYTRVQVVETYETKKTSKGNYEVYADGVLEYTRDGIAMLDEEGKEVWNQPCQMKEPIAEISEDTAAVADRGGTSIYVFQKKGLKGEIKTTRPIEKMSVSSQGIVATILQDEGIPKVICYDAIGNVLVEHKTSINETGYPMDIALSRDGKVLMVSYLHVKDMSTRVAFYYFGKSGNNEKDHQVMKNEYPDTVAPTVAFLDEETSLLVTDHSLVFYEGLEKPKQTKNIEIDKQIEKVCYSEDYVALVLKNVGETGYELRLYQTNGELKMSKKVDKEYKNIKIIDEQIFLTNQDSCAIYSASGICKFKGKLEMNILEIFPAGGINKYIVISANGFKEVQLAK